MPLCAVQGDPNSHGGGELIAANPQTVFINNLPVIDHGPTPANADALCPLPGGHCNPETAEGSPNVFYYFNPVHRMQDSRVCGATTVVQSQANVFANDGTFVAPIQLPNLRRPLPIDPVDATATSINYIRAIVNAIFNTGVPKSPGLPYGGDDAELKNTPITKPQEFTASSNWANDILAKIGPPAYVPYSNVSTGPFSTTEVTPTALAATQISYSKQILDLAKQKGIYQDSDRTPFTEKTSPGFTSTNTDLSVKQDTSATVNYIDKIINSPPLVGKFPAWPRLPFGDNNGNT